MRLIVCVDDEMGMAYNHRRVSSDSVVTQEIKNIVVSTKVWMTCYSAKLFLSTSKESVNSASSMHIMLSENPIQEAGKNDYCFLERESPTDISNVDEIIMFRWGRRYPSDVKFGVSFAQGWVLKSTKKIVGTSHKEIIEEVWNKNA